VYTFVVTSRPRGPLARALPLSLVVACSTPSAVAPTEAGTSDAPVADGGIVSSCHLSFAPSVVADDVPAKQQREPSVAVDGSGAIWIADNDIPDPNAGNTPPAVMKVSRSTDGGKTFQVVGQPYCGHDNCGNPLLAVDSADRVFLTYGALDYAAGNPRWTYLVRIDDHPDNPHAAPLLVSDDGVDSQTDREWIAIGPHDEIYVAWKRGYHTSNGEIRIARSDTNGVSFEPSTLVLGDALGSPPGYASIAVDANGVIKVAANTGPAPYSLVDRVVFTQSTDRGASFSPPVDLHAIPTQAIPAPFDMLDLYPSFPVIAVARDGFTHVAWSQQAADNPLRIDLVVASSADGAVFGPPTRVNDDSAPAFHMQPAIATDDLGMLYLTWLDSRALMTPPALWKMFASYSRDRGQNFEPNIDLGTPIFAGQQGNLFGLQAIGEFNGMTTAHGSVYAAWTDTRTGDSGVYLAIGRCEP
jgi:hypothetical protein